MKVTINDMTMDIHDNQNVNIHCDKQVIDKVCDLLISALNEGMFETSDIGKLNMWIREQLAKKAKSKNN